ncbi:MAG TPA: hypothetical protein VH497_10850 [Vicinamibacterales bacterium]|jgi:hypothetical protein
MDAEQHPVMSDAAIDHELRELLAVDPSADFPARVRGRIADDAPMRTAWWSSRVPAMIAAAAAVMIAIVFARTLPERSPEEAGRSAQSVALLDARPLPPLLLFEPLLAHSSAKASGERSESPSNEPEILIDAREAAALRALMRRASDGRIDLRPALAASAPRIMELSPIDDIAVAPIVIDPLEEGARQ